jgi:hypothetical protein
MTLQNKLYFKNKLRAETIQSKFSPHLPKFVKTQIYRSAVLSATLYGLETASLRFRDKTEGI